MTINIFLTTFVIKFVLYHRFSVILVMPQRDQPIRTVKKVMQLFAYMKGGVAGLRLGEGMVNFTSGDK